MLIATCLALCVVTVPLAGGRLSRLADLRFRATWAIVASLSIQLVIVYALADRGVPGLEAALVASYVLAIGFVVANRRVPGLAIVGLGGALNFAAIAANGGVMPARADALASAGLSRDPDGFASSVAVEGARLAALGDVFAVPASWPVHNVFSVGDILLILGVLAGLHAVSRSRVARACERVRPLLAGIRPRLAGPAPVGRGVAGPAPRAARAVGPPRARHASRPARRRAVRDRRRALARPSGAPERLAELVVRAGVDAQPGRPVAIFAELGQEDVVRAIAREAYRAGASFVDPIYHDPHVRRLRLEHADEASLASVPVWYRERVRRLAEQRAALVVLRGPSPGLLAGVDPARAGRDRLPFVSEYADAQSEGSITWTVAPAPTLTWAAAVRPGLSPADALERLWADVAHVCRLDADDPIAAWRQRVAELEAVAARLGALRLDALRFEGPGTDLRVGLLPSSRWATVVFESAEGVRHLANIPTEEVFTTPDPARVEGRVRVTRALELDGVVVRDAELRFEGGRAVEVRASEGEQALRARCAVDAGARRLGEVALVDGRSRVGALGTTFLEGLLDENAACHIALGSAYETCVDGDDLRRANRSEVHVDLMIGGPQVRVWGEAPGRERVPVLDGLDWAA